MKEKRLWLKGKRAEKDMSQREVAEQIGLSRVGYNLIETGTTKMPSISIIHKLAKLLDFRVEEFR